MEGVLELLDRGPLGLQLAQALRHVAAVGQPAEVDQAHPPVGDAHRAQHALQGRLVLRLLLAAAVGARRPRQLRPDLPQQGLQEAHEQGAQVGMELHVVHGAPVLEVRQGQAGQGRAQERLRLRQPPGEEPRSAGVLEEEGGRHRFRRAGG